MTPYDSVKAERDRLRAEVERLKAEIRDWAHRHTDDSCRVFQAADLRKQVATLAAERDALKSDVARYLSQAAAVEERCSFALKKLAAERDAARVEIRDATEALDEWRPGSRESLAAAVTRLRQALQAADIDLEELFAARKAMSPGGMQRRELPALVTALRAERESILAVVRDYASLMLSHDAVALVDRLRAVLKAGDKP